MSAFSKADVQDVRIGIVLVRIATVEIIPGRVYATILSYEYDR